MPKIVVAVFTTSAMILDNEPSAGGWMSDKNNARNDKRVLDSCGFEEGSSVIDYIKP